MNYEESEIKLQIQKYSEGSYSKAPYFQKKVKELKRKLKKLQNRRRKC